MYYKEGQVAIKTVKMNVLYYVLPICFFSFLQAIAAQVKVPLFFTPVPLTMQTFVLFLSIAFLRKRAAFSQALYITLGILGVPVFSNGAGFSYLFGPTGGYILGFFTVALVAPYFLDKMEKNNLSLLSIFSLFSFSMVWYLLLGVIWLKCILDFSLKDAFMVGAFPFVLGDLCKAGVAGVIAFSWLRRR